MKLPEIASLSRAGDKLIINLNPQQEPYPHGQLCVVLLTVEQARHFVTVADSPRFEETRLMVEMLNQQLAMKE